MHVRRLRSGRRATVRALGLILLMGVGCSQQEELPLDPGVSPFYPGNAGSFPSPAGTGAAATRTGGAPAASGIADDRAGTSPAASPGPESPLRLEDVERQLRIALRAVEKGDSARASRTLDRILALEPLNREALSGRAALALDQAQKATSPSDRAAAMETALTRVRTLRRAYEKATQRENELFGRILYAVAQMELTHGRTDRAVAALREAYEGGFDPFDQVENDAAMAALRSSSGYRALLQGIDDAHLARARSRVKDHLDRPVPMSFDFTLPDLDGKPVSLGQFRGQVVLIDLWGTWCKPCRDAMPGLIQLYRKHRRRGFQIVGIDYEKNPPDQAAAAVQMVKAFVQSAGLPYRCVIGDPATLEKIPDFAGFPTTMVIDRAGKVRVLIRENQAGTLELLDDAVTVLLADPVPPGPAAGTTKAAAQPK